MDAFLGEIRALNYTRAPMGWALCDGSKLPIRANTALFAVIGNAFGGDGQNDFALPDLRGRAAIGVGAGPGLTPKVRGETWGVEAAMLDTDDLAPHAHTITARVTTDTSQMTATPGPTAWLSRLAVVKSDGKELGVAEGFTQMSGTNLPDVPMSVVTVGPLGGETPHENRQPFLAMDYFICISGIFPS